MVYSGMYSGQQAVKHQHDYWLTEVHSLYQVVTKQVFYLAGWRCRCGETQMINVSEAEYTRYLDLLNGRETVPYGG